KTRGNQAAVKRGDLFLVDALPCRAAELAELPLNALSNERHLIRFGEDRFQGCINVRIRDASRAEFACNAEFPLTAGTSMQPRIVARIFRIIEIALIAQMRDDHGDAGFVRRAPPEILLHFMDG